MHATTDDPHAASPRICGDRRGKCPDGQHGQYTWVRPGAVDRCIAGYLEQLRKCRRKCSSSIFQGAVSGEDVYIREGMAALAGWQGAACTASSMEVKAQKKTYELLR